MAFVSFESILTDLSISRRQFTGQILIFSYLRIVFLLIIFVVRPSLLDIIVLAAKTIAAINDVATNLKCCCCGYFCWCGFCFCCCRCNYCSIFGSLYLLFLLFIQISKFLLLYSVDLLQFINDAAFRSGSEHIASIIEIRSSMKNILNILLC